jgi:hypothetical protein
MLLADAILSEEKIGERDAQAEPQSQEKTIAAN